MHDKGVAPRETRETIKLWDMPVRLFHWSLVVLIPALWWSAKADHLDMHKRLGLAVLALLLFRLLWGILGSSTARFTQFVRGPGAVLAYVLGKTGQDKALGHNPLGGWSVMGLLGILLIEVILGLFAQDVDGLEPGPLTHFVSYDAADAARHWHHFLFNGILVLVAVHVAAILFYLLVKRDNLIGAMVTGRKRVPESMLEPAQGAITAPLWKAALSVALAMTVTYWVSCGCPL